MRIPFEDLKGKNAMLGLGILIITFVIFYGNLIIGQIKGFTNESIKFNAIIFVLYFSMLALIVSALISGFKKEMQHENEKRILKTYRNILRI